MNQKDFDLQMMQEMEENKMDEAEDSMDDQAMNQQEWQRAYGAPEQVQEHNQHKFISDSLKFKDAEKVTFLNEWELGRPLFNVRFMLKIEDIAKYYLDELCKLYNVENKIAAYFRNDIDNTCDSGLSNKGFIQNLNVTKKMEATRERIKNLTPERNPSKPT